MVEIMKNRQSLQAEAQEGKSCLPNTELDIIGPKLYFSITQSGLKHLKLIVNAALYKTICKAATF